MKWVVRWKWLVLAIWIIAAAGLMLSAPSMADLVRDKGQIQVPEGYPSTAAAEMLKELHGREGGGALHSTLLVFHNDAGLNDADFAEMAEAARLLQASIADGSGVVSVVTHLMEPALTPQMLAEDGRTSIVLLQVSLEGREPAAVHEALVGMLEHLRAAHYFTGDWIINEDLIYSAQEGLKKTEIITVVLIVTILLLVFRSVAAPFIPLLTVGLSYLAAQSVVAFLVDLANFPLSTFTQIFMVAVMFGIGTDYCILLISRFKEELVQQGESTQAILATYRSAGRTVLVAGLAVLVGFTAIGFSAFTLYRSAVAVAVGVAVLLLALVTLVPFFMAVLGKHVFWPSRRKLEHKPSGLYRALGSFSLKRPIWSLLLLVVLLGPLLAGYDNRVSFNSLDEIGERYDSVKGFNLVAESFGPGETLPSTVVVEFPQSLPLPDGLAYLEQVSAELDAVEGVKAVRSASRPTGVPLDLAQLGGLQEAQEGQLQAMLAAYLSPDQTIASFEVVFEGDPYAQETMDRIHDLEEAAKRALDGTPYAGADLAVGGVTSTNRDLRDISSADYSRTVVLMIAGIALILIVLFRSLVIPLYVLASLIVTFFASMAVTELIFVDVLNYVGTSWSVSFFGFVMLMALGVDYSIFLMDRFKEYRSLPPRTAIMQAMERMGAVIISAAAILAGTFAAMLPSGVMSLLQIATIIISGLAIYAFVMLPLFIPVMVRLFGRANWWPFMPKFEAGREP
ncbi:MMPL family transporter [Xylanibacillus composti]|nr:MMPL family transporter [Xylanibacillus composti]MDT9723863.1 MMPL family transporter [Xylanibacillus composti]